MQIIYNQSYKDLFLIVCIILSQVVSSKSINTIQHNQFAAYYTMKAQSSYINKDESYQWKTTHNHKKKITQVLCPQGFKASVICFQKTCSSPAFACTQEKCSCEKLHQKCYLRKCTLVIKKLEQKLVNFQPVLTQVDKSISQKISYFQRMIESLIRQKKQLIDYLTETQSLFGMTQAEQYIYQMMINKNTDDILGRDMHKNEESIFKGVQNVVQPQMKKLKEFWKQPLIDINNLQKKINEFKQSYKKANFNFMRQKSKIVTSFDQKVQLNANFSKDIEKMQLLYKAEDQKFNFAQFKLKCGHISNTLILIKTDLKKIGCFTDLKWNQALEFSKGSQKMFLTSLTNHYRVKEKIEICFNKKYNRPQFKNVFNETLMINDQSIYCDMKIFETGTKGTWKTNEQPILQLEVWQMFLQK